MTAARQQPKERRAPIAVLALILGLFAGSSLGLAAGGITERIVVDRHTGLAIDGYDPVAFCTDGKPVPGSADFELQYGGAVLRFCNFGNQAAFAERPDVYCRSSAATIRSASPAAWPWPEGRTSG